MYIYVHKKKHIWKWTYAYSTYMRLYCLHTLMVIDFQEHHIVSSTEGLMMNKADSRGITRPFINPQFRRLGICPAHYNKRARPCHAPCIASAHIAMEKDGYVSAIARDLGGFIARFSFRGKAEIYAASLLEHRSRAMKVQSRGRLNYVSNLFPWEKNIFTMNDKRSREVVCLCFERPTWIIQTCKQCFILTCENWEDTG